jgi:hypothetical protein
MPMARGSRAFGEIGDQAASIGSAFERLHIGGFIRRSAMSQSIRPPPHCTSLRRAILRARPGIDRNTDVPDARYRSTLGWISS